MAFSNKATTPVLIIMLFIGGCCQHVFMFPEYGVDIEDGGYFLYDGLEFNFGPMRLGYEGFEVSCYKIINEEEKWEDDDLLLPPTWHGLQPPHIPPRCNITNETRFIPIRNTPYVLVMGLHDIMSDMEVGRLTNGTVTLQLQLKKGTVSNRP